MNLSCLNKVKSIIGVTAGKGGVGKSTVTVNLALSLQALGFSVGILDADLYGSSLQKMLPEDSSPIPLENGTAGIKPAGASGLELISMAHFRAERDGMIVRAPIANGLIEQFLHQVQWSALDFLLIDFPPGTGDIQLTLCQKGSLTGAIVVTTPQEIALLDVRKNVDFLQRVRVKILGVVENMSFFLHPETEQKIALFGEGGGASLASELDVPLLAQLPLDPKLCKACDEGRSIFNTKPLSESAQQFMQLAKQVSKLAADSANNRPLIKEATHG